jgi:hypothetical protein
MPRPIFEFLHGSSGVPDVLHRFGEPLLRYTEFVGPVLNFVGLQETDAASVLRMWRGALSANLPQAVIKLASHPFDL